jgi:hypothetical protein
MDAALLAALKQSEQNRTANRDAARRELGHYKSRVAELEAMLHLLRHSRADHSSDSSSSALFPEDCDRCVANPRLPPAGSSSESLAQLCQPRPASTDSSVPSQQCPSRASDSEGSRDRAHETQTIEIDVTQRHYIERLERFADLKCAEVGLLVKRLLDHRRRLRLLRQRVQQAQTAAGASLETQKQNRHLRNEIERLNGGAADFGIRHRDAKAGRKTRDLHELAALRAETERRDLDFHAFVVEQLSQFVDGEHGVDEDSVRSLVSKAGELVKRGSLSCEY